MILIATIIFFSSLLGMGVILYRKIPTLKELPLEVDDSGKNLFPRIKNKIKFFIPIKSFSSESILHKLLSKGRVLSLRAENRISGWQNQLRQKSKKQKETEDDNYWEELKKSTNRKDKNL